MTQKIGLFFGAGAEVCYGMPLGGSFALDIFCEDSTPDKETFQEQLDAIDERTNYGSWLPDGFASKRVWTFGTREFSALLESTLEYRRADLLNFLANFDQHAAMCLENWAVDAERFETAIQNLTGDSVGAYSYSHIRLNDALGADESGLFNSDYFSSFLHTLENHDLPRLRETIMAFVQLLIAAHGKTLVERLNERLFEDDGGLSFLEDMPQLFRLELSSIGHSSLKLILDSGSGELGDDPDDEEIVTAFALKTLASLLAVCLDYRSLIDHHFRYLYSPQVHWAKFTRIAIFLLTVRRYIESKVAPNRQKIEDGPGYYHDLQNLAAAGYEIPSVGTSNYNTFLREILHSTGFAETDIHHLNGGLADFYDPYLNKIVHYNSLDDATAHDRLLVPFMLTQSGTKPLTAIRMSERYVDLYRSFQECDVVAVIGFNFNSDDSHINGIFRSLTDAGKNLVVFHHTENDTLSAEQERKLRWSLRMENRDTVEFLPIDDNRRSGDQMWHEKLAALTS